ncbi:LamG domain-containing protein [Streptomyces sp. NPDC002928]|uniref:LamG domain-containing protein n=1 Tax=Streptomyces sp. NPDC002928 TaxID=3154440 RepID=UPI0033AC5AED
MGGAATASAAAEEAPAAGSDNSQERQALDEARQTGQRVEVTGQRTERDTVFANPDGTFRLEESAVPVRVATSGGGWQSPDATLQVRADGRIAPKAAAVDMVFSGGGTSDPLVSIDEGGRKLSVGWPGRLPEPVVDGATATYPEVLDGVDLRVTATVEGFQHVLVVKTPEAAKSSALKKIEYSLKTKDLDIVEGKSGNLAAVDDDGNRVFRSPPAQMWDSAGDTGAAAQPETSGAGTRTLTADTPVTEGSQPADPAEAAPSGSGLEPGQGDKVARMDVDVTEDSLSVVPDTKMLTGTDAAAFPLFIDPTVTWSEAERTLLRSDGYESYAWGNGDDDLGKGVGECGTWGGYYCGPGYVQRLYFEFSPASLKGKKVLDATFRVTEPWAFQCDPRWVDLVRTNNISSATTWSSRPANLDLMVDRNVSAGRGSLCDPDSPDAPIEFNDNPDETNENLTPTVTSFAAGKFSRLTLELKAHDETDTGAWKRFRNDAVLAVDFVGLPDKPSAIGLVTGSGTVCETDESDPAVISDPTPTLTATAQTKAGGEKDAQLRIAYDLDNKSGSTWVDTTPGNGDVRPSTGYIGDNTKVTLTWSTLTDGTLYRYRAWGRSYYDDGDSYLAGPSNASTTGWCYFKVDSSAPKAPTITVGSPYSVCTPTDCKAAGGPGTKGTFVFGPATGDTNVAYQYKLSSTAAWSAAVTGATVSQPITPERSGTYTIYVRAKDSVGRWGAQNAVDFLVAAGDGPVGRWHFDEESGVAVDTATADGSDDATLGGGALRDDRGRRGLITHDASGVPLDNPVTDKGLALDGVDDYAETSGAVLETRSAYTVSAWARLDKGDKNVSVLGQPGEKGNTFMLWYLADVKQWFFGVLKQDGSTVTGRYSSYPAQTGVWTHLAGSYDPASGELVFYVDGRRQGSALATDAGSWASTGGLQFGRYKFPSGSGTYYFPGSIDEVAVWQRVLTAEEVADEARLMTSEGYAGAELVADWSADRGSGTTIPDTTSGYGKSLTLAGGAALDGEAITLDGVDDAATASGPLVYDHGAFTVSTLVQLDGAKLVAKDVGYTGQVLGQRTADGSAWGFWFQMTGKETVLDEDTLEERTVPVGLWHFGRLNTDGTFSSVVSDEVAAMDSEVRLTGTYDPLTGTISLYLGHNQNGADTAFTVALGSGDFAVGKGFTNSAWGHFLPARVQEVRLWAGAMASSDQIDDRVGD